jgi:hypothetical protein
MSYHSFFSLVSFAIEVCAWKREAVLAAGPVHPEKEVRPSGEVAV